MQNSTEKALYENAMKIGGIFEADCFDKNGNRKWSDVAKNLVVNEGLNHILNVQFHGTTQVGTWYVGLKKTGSPATADTLASHAGWAEATGFTTGLRKAYTEATASGKSITNSANKASYAISATATISGAFVCSVTSGSSGILFCAANFTTPRAVESGDTLEVTYTLSVADDGV
jgi:hypothetical protein